MGNLRAKLPKTYWTYLIGAAALAGIPLLSGFFSKDEILWYAWQKSPVLWGVGLITAALTAIYSFRSVFVPFWGQERDHKLLPPRARVAGRDDRAADHAGGGRGAGGLLGIPRLSLIEHWLEPVFARRQGRRRRRNGGGRGVVKPHRVGCCWRCRRWWRWAARTSPTTFTS